MKKLAVLGPKGTYSDKAALRLNLPYEIKYYPSIAEVIQHMDEDTDALVPFENTLDGFVMESLDGIIQNQVTIHSQVKLDVDFTFVSHAEKIEDVKAVYVQFKAYGQCQDFILKHHLKPIITQSNIESLDLIKKEERQDIGAIVPSHIDSSSFALSIVHIVGDIHDETRFVLLSKKGTLLPRLNALSCSIAILPKKDKPGLLYSLLKRFSKHHINLKAILSRPRRDTMGKYIFYMEIELSFKNLASLTKIHRQIEEKEDCIFQLLGFYNSL